MILDTSTVVQNGGILSGNAETLILASVYPLQVAFPQMINSELHILTLANINAGAGCTGITVRFRRTYGLTGTVDDQIANLAVTPGQVCPVVYTASANPEWLMTAPGGQYSVTFQQQGASPANGTVLSASAMYYFNDSLD